MQTPRLLLVFVLLLFAVQAAHAQQDCPDSCTIFVPNTLAPDCDEVGCELLEIVSNCTFLRFDLTLYDRWGNVYFHSDDPRKKFDAVEADEGTYILQLDAQTCNGRPVSLRGQVTVLK